MKLSGVCDMKKILILLFSLVALVSCCDTSSMADLMTCQEHANQSMRLLNDFKNGTVILLCTSLVLSVIFAIIYKIKNKNKYFKECFEEYSWVFFGGWIVVTIMWAISVYLFNGSALLKYIGIA